MSQQTKTDFKADVSATIFTNKKKLVKGNTVRDKLLNLADSVVFLEQANVNGGYLLIDLATGLVDVSFIQIADATQDGIISKEDWNDIVFKATANQNGGYLLIDLTSGLVDISFIQKVDATKDGILSKENWSDFKNASNGINVFNHYNFI